MTIPAGALPSPVLVSVERDATGAPAFPSDAVFTAGAPYAVTPHGTTFAVPATVRIPFDPALVPSDGVPLLYQAEPDGGIRAHPHRGGRGTRLADVGHFSWFIPGYAASRPRMVYAFTFGTNVPEVSASASTTATAGSASRPAARPWTSGSGTGAPVPPLRLRGQRRIPGGHSC